MIPHPDVPIRLTISFGPPEPCAICGMLGAAGGGNRGMTCGNRACIEALRLEVKRRRARERTNKEQSS